VVMDSILLKLCLLAWVLVTIQGGYRPRAPGKVLFAVGCRVCLYCSLASWSTTALRRCSFRTVQILTRLRLTGVTTCSVVRNHRVAAHTGVLPTVLGSRLFAPKPTSEPSLDRKSHGKQPMRSSILMGCEATTTTVFMKQVPSVLFGVLFNILQHSFAFVQTLWNADSKVLADLHDHGWLAFRIAVARCITGISELDVHINSVNRGAERRYLRRNGPYRSSVTPSADRSIDVLYTVDCVIHDAHNGRSASEVASALHEQLAYAVRSGNFSSFLAQAAVPTEAEPALLAPNPVLRHVTSLNVELLSYSTVATQGTVHTRLPRRQPIALSATSVTAIFSGWPLYEQVLVLFAVIFVGLCVAACCAHTWVTRGEVCMLVCFLCCPGESRWSTRATDENTSLRYTRPTSRIDDLEFVEDVEAGGELGSSLLTEPSPESYSGVLVPPTEEHTPSPEEPPPLTMDAYTPLSAVEQPPSFTVMPGQPAVESPTLLSFMSTVLSYVLPISDDNDDIPDYMPASSAEPLMPVPGGRCEHEQMTRAEMAHVQTSVLRTDDTIASRSGFSPSPPGPLLSSKDEGDAHNAGGEQLQELIEPPTFAAAVRLSIKGAASSITRYLKIDTEDHIPPAGNSTSPVRPPARSPSSPEIRLADTYADTSEAVPMYDPSLFTVPGRSATIEGRALTPASERRALSASFSDWIFGTPPPLPPHRADACNESRALGAVAATPPPLPSIIPPTGAGDAASEQLLPPGTPPLPPGLLDAEESSSKMSGFTRPKSILKSQRSLTPTRGSRVMFFGDDPIVRLTSHAAGSPTKKETSVPANPPPARTTLLDVMSSALSMMLPAVESDDSDRDETPRKNVQEEAVQVRSRDGRLLQRGSSLNVVPQPTASVTPQNTDAHDAHVRFRSPLSTPPEAMTQHQREVAAPPVAQQAQKQPVSTPGDIVIDFNAGREAHQQKRFNPLRFFSPPRNTARSASTALPVTPVRRRRTKSASPGRRTRTHEPSTPRRISIDELFEGQSGTTDAGPSRPRRPSLSAPPTDVRRMYAEAPPRVPHSPPSRRSSSSGRRPSRSGNMSTA
jgi:hypothetical protein